MVVAQTHLYADFIGNVVLLVTFLWLLVGWECLLAGSAAIGVFIPINGYLVRRYARYQKALMRARDRKTTVITEALNGIRQINSQPQKNSGFRKSNLIAKRS